MAAPPANAAAPVPVTRIAGANRFGTAAAIAQKAFPAGASTVIVATGFNFPDALAGNYLAGVDKAPILLVNVDNVPSETSAALQALKAKNVIILGQTNAVDTNTENQLKAAGYTTSRIGGATRLETMQMIDEAPNATTIGLVNGKKTALLARADNFPDALGGGPVAYSKNFPVILTATGALSPQAQDVITKDGIQQVIILGGPLAISSATESQANAAGAATLFRANGVDRSDTSRLLGEYAISNLGFTQASYGIASGDQGYTGADALASGPFSGGIPQPTLVTNSINDPGTLVQFGQAHNAAATNVYAFGGPIPLPDSTVNAVANATPTNAAATSLPQLTSASILKTVTAGSATSTNPAGTTIQYVFSQNVSAATLKAIGFRAWPSAGAPPYGAAAVALDSANPNAVDAFFSDAALQTTTGAAALTLATVAGPQMAAGPAVTLPAGMNPDGSAAIGTASTTNASAAGVTAGPNAESWAISNTSGANPVSFPSGTPVNITFDKAAITQTAAAYPVSATAASSGFNAVVATTSGGVNEVACFGPAPADTTTPSGGTIAGGNGTTTLTVVCQDVTASTPIPAASILRVIVQTGAVKSSAATGSVSAPLQAADTPRASGDSPSLSSVAFLPGSTSAGTTDQIVYTFDRAVTVANGAKFGFYTSSGAQTTCTASNVAPAAGTAPCLVAVNPSNFTQVVATVGTTASGAPASPPTGAGATANATGANVASGGVANANAPLNLNGDDELGAANPNNAPTTVTPGTVSAPQLSSVKLITTTTVTGTTYSVQYTFTVPVGAPVPGNLHLYDADGTELTCAAATTGASATSTPSNSVVTCSAFNQGATATPATVAQLTGAKLGTADYSTVVGLTAPNNNPNPEGGVNVG